MPAQAGLNLIWSQPPKTGFLVTRLLLYMYVYNNDPKYSDRQVWGISVDQFTLLLGEQSDQCVQTGCTQIRLLSAIHSGHFGHILDRVKRIWYLSPMRVAKVQASLRIRAVSPEPSLLAHASSESRGIFRQKARSLAPLNGWACAVKICHDGMLEDTNSLDGAHMVKSTHFKSLV